MTFQDDVFENVTRLPGGNWTGVEVTWTNVLGEEALAKELITCPFNWKWTDTWIVDLSRAVDEIGRVMLQISLPSVNADNYNYVWLGNNTLFIVVLM